MTRNIKNKKLKIRDEERESRNDKWGEHGKQCSSLRGADRRRSNLGGVVFWWCNAMAAGFFHTRPDRHPPRLPRYARNDKGGIQE